MWALFDKFQKKRKLKRLLLEFKEEIKKNLESYYVMFQLGKLKFFQLEVWQKLKNESEAEMSSSILRYAQILGDYNKVLADFKNYEQWFASDINNKTASNAEVLHEKNSKAKEKFQGLEQIIKSALHDFEIQLLRRKILNNISS